MSKKKEEFESKLKRLEEITEQLESGKLGLEESIEAYKEGIEIARTLISKLRDAEKKIQMIQKDGILEFDSINEFEVKVSDITNEDDEK